MTIVAEPQQDHPAAIEQCQTRDRQSAPDCEPQGQIGKAERGVYCEPHHLEQRIFGLARSTLEAVEGDLGLPEAEPGDHAAYEAVLLRHLPKRVEHLAIDQAEVADVGGGAAPGKPAEEPGEQTARRAPE